MQRVDAFLSEVTDWARGTPGILAVALVGSHARGSADETSDVDLLLICESPDSLLTNRVWAGNFGSIMRQEVEAWGKVRSLRVWYQDGLEAEFGLAGRDWAADPDDSGDARVIADGIQVLVDRRRWLELRIQAFGRDASGSRRPAAGE